MKKKLLVITTGGTIAMKYDDEFGVIQNDELTAYLGNFPQIRDIAQIEVYEFTNIPSPYITPETMFKLARLVEDKILEYDGIIITHGTDTLEETAYFLELVVTTHKPVVFTAAMRSESELGLDGPRNIVGAVRVACSNDPRNGGVMVVMNDEINSAREVVKTDTGKTNSFVSLAYGPLGIIEPDKVIFYRDSIIQEKIPTDKIETNIDLIKCVSGMDDRYLQCSLYHGAKAIVLEAFGRGNVPPNLLPAITTAIERDVIVVIVSRTYTGRVLPEYGYEGGGKSLKKMGAILGGDLRGQKMRIKLMVLFGRYKDSSLVRKYLLNGN
ncbi:MAG: asparaginase [Candidatus Cloacimonetes bacterium]|nr:asparaginase [Candidatus Cloacimonadota bacterium]